MSSWPRSSRDAHLLGRIVLDDEQLLAPRHGEILDARQCLAQAFDRGRLGNERERAAREAVLPVLVQRDICTGIWRVSGSCFSWLNTVQPSMSGRKTSSETAVGLNSRGELERVGAAHGNQHLEAVVVRKIDDDARVMRVVLDDQQHRIARLDVVAVVGDRFDRSLGIRN